MTGGFFSVDLGAFRCAAAGGLNQAIAHLFMARGTARDNRTTRWSKNSVERHTGMPRPNAARAVGGLLERANWKKTHGGTHPVYKAVPGERLPRGPFTPDELEALAIMRAGKTMPSELVAIADRLATQGYATEFP